MKRHGPSGSVPMGGRTGPVFAAAWMARSGDPLQRPDQQHDQRRRIQTLRDPERNNTTVISGDPIAAIRRLKEQPGQDIVQYGFGQLSYALLEHRLLDELRFRVHPLFVSQATPAGLLFRPSATAQVELTGTLALTRRMADEKCRHAGPAAR